MTKGEKRLDRQHSTLPQLVGERLLVDGGLETTLVYRDGIELPDFAAFVLIDDASGRARLRSYFEGYLEIAREAGAGFVLETPTWRASADWGHRLGYNTQALAAANLRLVEMLSEIRRERSFDRPVVLSGCVGPRGDGYVPGERMSPRQAEEYHGEQIQTFAGTEVDMLHGLTLNYVDEAIGIVEASKAAGLPAAISFTVETDGKLAGGETLGEAIEAVDAATSGAAAYFMINCAHPTHFEGALVPGASWMDRLIGIRANASSMSHAELDAATELDAGDPEELGRQYRALLDLHPGLRVLGGCCGTDERHVRAIARLCCAG